MIGVDGTHFHFDIYLMPFRLIMFVELQSNRHEYDAIGVYLMRIATGQVGRLGLFGVKVYDRPQRSFFVKVKIFTK